MSPTAPLPWARRHCVLVLRVFLSQAVFLLLLQVPLARVRACGTSPSAQWPLSVPSCLRHSSSCACLYKLHLPEVMKLRGRLAGRRGCIVGSWGEVGLLIEKVSGERGSLHSSLAVSLRPSGLELVPTPPPRSCTHPASPQLPGPPSVASVDVKVPTLALRSPLP